MGIVRGQLLEQAGPATPGFRRKFKLHFHYEENFTFTEKIIVRGQQLQTERILTTVFKLFQDALNISNYELKMQKKEEIQTI